MSGIDEAKLIHGLRSGDDQATQHFVDRFYEPLLGFIFRMLQDHQGAEDVCQEAFVRAMQRIDQLRDPKGLRSWLYQIATNLARDYIRRRPQHALLDDVAVMDVATRDNGPDEQLRERLYVADLLSTLSEEQREVIVLRFYEDFSLAAIGEVLGIPMGTVKSRLHYALRALREQLTNEQGEVANGAAQRRKTSPSHVG